MNGTWDFDSGTIIPGKYLIAEKKRVMEKIIQGQVAFLSSDSFEEMRESGFLGKETFELYEGIMQRELEDNKRNALERL